MNGNGQKEYVGDYRSHGDTRLAQHKIIIYDAGHNQHEIVGNLYEACLKCFIECHIDRIAICSEPIINSHIHSRLRLKSVAYAVVWNKTVEGR